MAIVHVNGFGTIPVAGDAVTSPAPTSGTSVWSRQTGRYGGRALRHANTTNNATVNYANRLYLPLPTGLEFSVGVAVNHRAAVTAAGGNFGFRATPSSGQWDVQLGTGSANAYNNPGGTTVWTVVDSSFTAVGWHWWNWVFKSHATAGVCRLYRDGTLIAQAESDTVPTTSLLPWVALTIYMGNDNGGAQCDIGDLIVRDDASIIPDMVVASLFPDGTSAAALVGSDGNSTDNHLLVNENPTYSAATYVGSATVGAADTYTLGNLPGAGTIVAVQAAARAFKSDAGAKTMSTLINATERAAVDPGGGVTIYQVTTTDGGVAWTEAKVNAATLGVKVVS